MRSVLEHFPIVSQALRHGHGRGHGLLAGLWIGLGLEQAPKHLIAFFFIGLLHTIGHVHPQKHSGLDQLSSMLR
jgi:hypothetical protein